ncbi:HNH endonuclease signature motif containing protein [Microbacterium azadirachtae]|uniref:HNH endonuclease signature motif containing protein n=1 Tax=Microbacterium azadirachtae TaxID=582680 RepID=UPI0008827AA4|nr:HNH endonuclease signature motif containing protein [Microbacterium azadirachtae]SDL87905.1 protein of unknown function [Microbacterium azadirachtae]SEG19428.1 protein of unknown function [Microbacterium azadirachtae]SEG21744.1 protein of unknown function [Microbacterium azadirachtae]
MDHPLDRYLRRSAEIVAECVELEREIARLQAQKAALAHERVSLLLDEVRPGSAGFDQAEGSMICELAAALRLSRYAAAKLLATGHALQERFPATRSAFAAGEVSSGHVEAVVEAAAHIPHDDHAALAAYEAQVVPFAAAESRARTKALAETVAAAVAPVALIEVHRRAHADRTVSVSDEGAGQATLRATGPAALIHAAHDLLTQEGRTVLDRAKHAAASGHPADERRLDQVRFDRFLLRVLTGRVAGDADVLDAIRPVVQVTVATGTLGGRDEWMAELDGRGPMDPELARRLAVAAPSWQRMLLDDAGMVTRTGTYQPTEAMRRFLRARDRTCRFPGCRQPARRCQIDHTHDFARGGATDLGNLACLCETHHALKHPDVDPRWRWTAEQRPGGVIVWTTPAGVPYTDVPPPRVMFGNADDDGADAA